MQAPNDSLTNSNEPGVPGIAVRPAHPSLWTNRLDLQAALAAPEKPLDWVLPWGLLAGTVGVLVSPGGTGKSMLALGLAATVAAGRDAWGLLGSNPKQGSVVFLSLEDPDVILCRRLRALDVACPGVLPTVVKAGQLHILARQGTGFTMGAWDPKVGAIIPSDAWKVLGEELAASMPRLFVLDTLNRALGGMAENDNAIQGAVGAQIERAIAPTGTAALVLHHASKSATLAGQGETQQFARGAGAIIDNARFQINLTGMTKEQAKERGVPDEQHHWVQSVVPKASYTSRPPDRWLRRGENGVLSGEDPPAIKYPPATQPKRRKGGRGHDAD
jgi:RecA-family ATPase